MNDCLHFHGRVLPTAWGFFMVKLVGLCHITCDSDRNWERIVSLGLLRMPWFNSIHSCVWSYLLCMQFTLSTSRETRQSNVWCCVCVTLYHGLHIVPMISFLSYLHYFLGVSHPLLNSKMNIKVRHLTEQCLEEHENHCMTVDGLQHIVTFEITLLMTGEMLVLIGCQEIALYVEN